jgi:hypothetical protein
MKTFVYRLFPVVVFIYVFLFSVGTLSAQDYVNDGLPWHEAVLDPQGRLLAWYQPEKNLGYDKFLRLDWDFLEHKVPNQGNTGLKVYLVNSVFDPDTLQGIKSKSDIQHDPAGLYAHMVDLLVGWYAYAGDIEALPVVRSMLDYQMAHGTTPPDWEWASVPYATSCDNALEYGGCIRDRAPDASGSYTPGITGGIESDKVGELGLGYVLFYQMTGERKYLDAAVKCAQALAKHIRPGDGTHTPWPYRLNARTGATINGEEFGGMIVAPVRLFDELARLGVGDGEGFHKARDMAWNWILHNQLSGPARDRWTGYYEDVVKDVENVNDLSPMTVAYYILSRDDPSAVDPDWREHVGHLLDWDREVLGRGPYFGAWAIDEQQRPAIPAHVSAGCCSRAGLPCRSAGWGAINAMYYEKTRDASARENAFRSLNYATYFAASDGKIACCGFTGIPNIYWFEDGYADAGRSFIWAMGAIPDLAPLGEDHLLRSSSVVQKVSYGKREVDYRTFDKQATEVLRLSFKPARVLAGGTPLSEQTELKMAGYTQRPLANGDYVIQVHHTNSNEVAISGN